MVIYKIENKINGKIYIGKTTIRLCNRIAQHVFCNKFPIGKAFKKYGRDSFLITIVDESEVKKNLSEKEIFWIKYYNCKSPNGYNLTDGGEGNNCKRSEESRAKMSISRKGTHPTEETRKKISLARLGTLRSKETREKLSRIKQQQSEKISMQMKEIWRKRKNGEIQNWRITGKDEQ